MGEGPVQGFALRVAVLGCGSIGSRHIRNLRQLHVAEVIGYDVEPAARQRAETELGIPVAPDLEAVWRAQPDVVVVATATDTHVALASAAVAQGCQVFIEKPLSHELAGARRLCEEIRNRGVMSMVGCNMRFHPGPAALQRLTAEGAVGLPMAARLQGGSYLPRWRPAQDYRRSYSASLESGGIILDGIHELDLACWYFGAASLLAAVSLPARSLGLETDGLAEMLLRHEGGVLTNIHLNYVQRDYRRTCQIIGATGTLYWDFMAGRVEQYGEDGQLVRSLEQAPGWQLNQMYVDEMVHFLQAVAAGRPAVNSAAEGLATLELALRARAAGREHCQ